MMWKLFLYEVCFGIVFNLWLLFKLLCPWKFESPFVGEHQVIGGCSEEVLKHGRGEDWKCSPDFASDCYRCRWSGHHPDTRKVINSITVQLWWLIYLTLPNSCVGVSNWYRDIWEYAKFWTFQLKFSGAWELLHFNILWGGGHANNGNLPIPIRFCLPAIQTLVVVLCRGENINWLDNLLKYVSN